MTNTALVGDDDLIGDAGFDGIGRRTTQHLESVGLTTVRQLADARADLTHDGVHIHGVGLDLKIIHHYTP